MSLYGLYLHSPLTDSYLLLHMERTYMELCNKGLILIFLKNWKKKREIFEKM